MLYFAMFFPFMFGEFFDQAEGWFHKTRLSSYRGYFVLGIIILAIFSSIVPSLTFASQAIDEVPDPQHLDALEWLRWNSDSDDIVLVPLSLAAITQERAERTVILNGAFLATKDASQRYEDIDAIYTALYKTNALSLLTKYGVDYVIFSPAIGDRHGVDALAFIDERCFEKVYDEGVTIHKVRCTIGGNDAG